MFKRNWGYRRLRLVTIQKTGSTWTCFAPRRGSQGQVRGSGLRGVTPRAYNQRMRNLNLHVTVPADRRVIVQLPDDVDPGEADITIIVRRRQAARAASSILDRLPSLSVGSWPEGSTFSRSEMYGDDER